MLGYYILLLIIGVNSISRRAAIDIGSGNTKFTIADVENTTIINVIKDVSFPVPYQSSLSQSQNNTFDDKIKSLGLDIFRSIKQLLDEHQVYEIAAIATSAFRRSNNTNEFISQIKDEIGLDIKIITQKEESEISFLSAFTSDKHNISHNLVVLDIGTSSIQISTTNNNELLTHMGEEMGSVSYKNHIINSIQNRTGFDSAYQIIDSPNPITKDNSKQADKYGRSFARRASNIIKTNLKANNGTAIGIGRLFYHSIKPLAENNGIINRKGLRNFIKQSLNKSDSELNMPFSHSDVSNCILTLAIMKALHIHRIIPIETTNTRGILISNKYYF